MEQPKFYQLEKAIFLYSNGNNNYLEHRRVVVRNNKYEFGEGIPFSVDEYQELREAIPNKDKISHFSFYSKDSNLLHFELVNNTINLSWICIGNQRDLKFDNQTEIKSGKYWVPNLLFNVVNNSLHVYALKSSTITKDTILYNAPFPNVNTTGYVCEGNIEVNKLLTNINDLMKEWERFFFNSEFTHLSNTKISYSKISDVYNKILDKTIKYPNNELVKLNKAKYLLEWMN
jgi:PRTRC genetic system protein B